MSEVLQTGQHPDADQLSAFAELALPAHEHAEVLAHMTGCATCREVAMLALPPMEDAAAVHIVEVRRPWFSGWRLVWPAMALVGAMLVVVVYRHEARPNGGAPGQEVAEVREAAPLPPPSAAPAVEAAKEQAKVSGAERQAPAVVGGMAAKVPAAVPPKVANQKDLAALPMEGRNFQMLQQGPAGQQQGYLAPQQQGPSGQQIAPAVALGQGYAVGGPMPQPKPAPMMAGSAAGSGVGSGAPPALHMNAVPPPPAAAPMAIPAPATPARQQMAVTVDGAQLAVDPNQNASTTVITGAAMDALSDDAEVLKGATAVNGTTLRSLRGSLRGPLPSKLAALSVVAQGRRVVAIDTAHALFVSEDGGTQWKEVKARWKGQAVSVELVRAGASVVAAATPAATTVNLGRGIAGAPTSGKGGGAAGAESISTASDEVVGGAAVSGVVTDPSGAVIPGASVKVTNGATGAAISTATDRAGRYVVSGLAPGTYRMDVAMRGFETLQTSVGLTASQRVVSNLRLTVGAQSETVTVTNAAPQIETEQATLGALVGGKTEAKAKKVAPPVFAITTEKGERWVSADGESWVKQ
jgi:Carboxypeptidase regulatory-like domain